MIGNPCQFKNFTPCQSLSPITVADGSVSSVSGFGTVNTSSLVLDRVLHVPKLSFNLLSVNQLTKSLNCSVTFFPTHCVFQDLQTNTMTGQGSESRGVYYLNPNFEPLVAAVGNVSPYNWHCRLGHPSISSLKKVVF